MIFLGWMLTAITAFVMAQINLKIYTAPFSYIEGIQSILYFINILLINIYLKSVQQYTIWAYKDYSNEKNLNSTNSFE